MPTRAESNITRTEEKISREANYFFRLTGSETACFLLACARALEGKKRFCFNLYFYPTGNAKVGVDSADLAREGLRCWRDSGLSELSASFYAKSYQLLYCFAQVVASGEKVRTLTSGDEITLEVLTETYPEQNLAGLFRGLHSGSRHLIDSQPELCSTRVILVDVWENKFSDGQRNELSGMAPGNLF
ncbi:MAG: hypothetical protein ABIB61_01010 [Candidatus Shapirobacteria bacterium]